MIDRNEIPNDIGEFVEYDDTSSTFLRWKKILGQRSRVSIGDDAGYLDHTGYYHTKFNSKQYLNHRIVFFLYNGYCPDCIDHIDGNPKNNNINNLREASMSENKHNSIIPKNNTTGVKGLSVSRKTYWRLQIWKNNKIAFLEYYKLTEKTKDECRIILENKRKELHGSFTNHG